MRNPLNSDSSCIYVYTYRLLPKTFSLLILSEVVEVMEEGNPYYGSSMKNDELVVSNDIASAVCLL